jgi:replicative DNA helicase
MADGSPTVVVPPHDTAAERAVLGAILLAGIAAVTDVEAIVTSADFYAPAHATVFAAAVAMRQRDEPIDVVTLAAELHSRERLTTVGGAQFLGELTDTTVTTAHLEHHARIVASLAQVRRLIAAAHDISARAYGARGAVGELLSWAEKRVLAATERRTRTGLRPIGDFVEQAFERFERAGTTPGLATGFADLDALTLGLHPGQLIVLAGRPRMGKSALALNIANHVACENVGVAFFSQEMPGREYADRQLATTARVEQSKLRSVKLSTDEFAALSAAGQRVFTLPLWIDEGLGVTLHEIASKVRRAVARDRVGLVVIDHLQLTNHERGRDERADEAIGRTTRGLKALAKELSIPVLLLSQLNRDCEKERDKRPGLLHLRGSGDIEQDADVVMFLYRDEVYDRQSPDHGIAELHVAKQRNGAEGVVRLAFNGPLTEFTSLAADDARRTAPERPTRLRRRGYGGGRGYEPRSYHEPKEVEG